MYNLFCEKNPAGIVEKYSDKIIHLIKDDDPHDLAFDNNDPALVVDAHAPRVLQDLGPELAHELAVLIVDLNLKNNAINFLNCSSTVKNFFSEFYNC